VRRLLYTSILLAACGEDPPAPTLCTDFNDCAADQICVAGKCETATELTLVTEALPLGKVGEIYDATLDARGGTEPYTFAVVGGGALPAGLALETNGAISGTPTTPGTATFTAQVTDADGAVAMKMLSIAIKPDAATVLRIVTTTLPNGTEGVAYQASITAEGGAAPYMFSVATGTLPAGIALATDGTLSGTPSAAGTSIFTVQVSDGSDQLATAMLTLVIDPAIGVPLEILTMSLPNGALAVAYTAMLEATGGTTPYAWSLAGGTSLPSGLVLDPSGAISGTPTQEGTINFQVRVADASQSAQEAVATLSITIGAGALMIDTATLPDGEVGLAYTATVVASGGTAPYAFSVATGALPPGLQLAPTGAITGTPTSPGTFTLSVQATDSSVSPQVAARSYSIAILDGNVTPLQLTTATLPDGMIGVAYAGLLTASAGTTPYSFTVDAGSNLPPGLNLAPDGTIDGTPTTAGTYSFTITVIDSSNPQQTASAGFTIVVIDPQVGLVITTSLLPAGTANVAYTQQLSATGGATPYTWLVVGGALPPGLNLAADGTLSGVPTTAGTYTFTAEVMDANGATAQAALTLTINPDPNQGLVITTLALPRAVVGRPYAVTLTASGGTTPYSWSVASGTLPEGLMLSADGMLTGTASIAGSYTFAIQVVDSSTTALSDTRQYTLTVIASPSGGVTLVVSSLPPGRVGRPYVGALHAAGGTAPYTYTVIAGELPPGLTLTASGRFTGTATAAGTFTFTVRVVDSSNPRLSSSRVFTITIRPANNAALLSISTNNLPPAHPNVPYSRQLNASGGTPPYMWSVSAGTLPGGIVLDAAGLLSGTATITGTYPITISVSDSAAAPQTASRNFTLRVQ
jgi:hypothetical protein